MISIYKDLVPNDIILKLVHEVYNNYYFFFSKHVINFIFGEVLTKKIYGIGKLVFHLPQSFS